MIYPQNYSHKMLKFVPSIKKKNYAQGMTQFKVKKVSKFIEHL